MTAKRKKYYSYSIEHALFLSLSMTIIFFAGWTVACHLAVLTGQSWQHLKYGFLVLLPVLMIFSWKLSVVGARFFQEETTKEQPQFRLTTDWRFMLLLLVWMTLIVVIKNYDVRYAFTSIFLILIWFTKALSHGRDPEPAEIKPQNVNGRYHVEYLALAILIMAAIVVTLCAHRPDLDDSSYLQTALSTLRNPTLPIFSFDTSLGNLVGQFRFPPTLLTSYELLSALVADFTRISLLSVYYIIIPAISAALTIIVAFLLSRWFLPSRAAVIAVAIFFLICLAWGESHVAYGNRLFVRLFQGKGLLIAIITPSIIFAGLLAMRRPSWQTRLLFGACIVAGLGVSSTGLIVTIVVGSLAIVSGMVEISRESVRKALFTATPLSIQSLLACYSYV
ncbi:MAG: DUF6077 domain-containing protein [Syntrophales bacterium]